MNNKRTKPKKGNSLGKRKKRSRKRRNRRSKIKINKLRKRIAKMRIIRRDYLKVKLVNWKIK